MPLHPRTCCLLYTISCLLDALDGFAARRFGQSTRFGAVLDMVTDRCTTACLLVFLASAFPRWSIVFQGLISLMNDGRETGEEILRQAGFTTDEIAAMVRDGVTRPAA